MGTGTSEWGDDELLARLLQQQGFAVDIAVGPEPRPSAEPAAAGPSQRRFWLQERVEDEPGLNNLGCLIRFPAPLAQPALLRALDRLSARHESLRTRFLETDGDLVEWVGQPSPPPLHRLPATGDAAALRGFVEQPFRLDQAPLWRIALFDAAGDADALLLACHHIILDWSGAHRFAEELALLYQAESGGHPATLPPRPLQQADYSHWLRGEARARQAGRERDHWRQRFATVPPALALPAAAKQGGNRCHAVELTLDPALTAAVRRFAAARGTTPFTVLLAAYAATLGRFAQSEDVCIGTAVDNRDHPGTEAIVGCLTDMVPLRCDLAGEPGFGALTQRLHASVAEDFQHKALGLAEMVALAAPDRRSKAAPLFQAVFNLLPEAGASSLRPVPTSFARADLMLELRDEGVRLAGQLEYRDGLLPDAVARAIAAALPCLLRHGMAMPDRPVPHLALLEEREAAAQFARLNPPLPAPDEETLASLFLARAQRQPDAVALIEGDRRITYGALLERSTALAERLVEAGLRPEQPVAICLERSIDLAVALVAAVRAGGAILPLDPGYPAARLGAILADSGAPFLIARETPPWLPDAPGCTLIRPDSRPGRSIALPTPRPRDCAYLIYTSGSTGRPKGVIGLHRGAVNRLRWMWRDFPFQPGEISCQKTSIAFVDFVWEFFGPLLAGIPSVIADAETARDPQLLTALIRDRRVSRLVLVPSLLRAWLDGVADLPARLAFLRVCVSSGEALPVEIAGRFRAAAPGCRLLNLYGSSEVSADAAWHEIDGREAGRMPIGRPIPGNRIAILDSAGQPLPIGAPGEIAIQGVGVARGYLNDPAQTATRFAATEDAARALFRSGDIGFWDAEGRLVYLGRRDRQAKIAGVRIEPGEIEAVLATHPDVRASHVLVRQDESGTPSLAAYLVGQPGVSVEDIRAFLADRLPRALLPDSVMLLDRLPLTASGKIDAAALSPPQHPQATAPAGPRAALEPMEAMVAAIWSDALGRAITGRDADFFALGGNSLRAILCMGRLGEALGRTLPVALLFETPRLADLARRLGEAPDRADLPPPQPRTAEGPPPATSNQLWLWDEYRREPGGIAYNLPLAYRLDGPLDDAALETALGAIFARHEALRTRLAPTPSGVAQIVDAPPVEPMRRHDLSGEADPDSALQALLDAVSRQPFALDRDLPLRAILARLAPDRHCMVLVMHHVACDGWSGQILVQELAALYAADAPPPTPTPPRLQCGDIADWQQQIRPLLVDRLETYRQSLAEADAPHVAGLRADAPQGGPVGLVPVEIDAALLARFLELRPSPAVTPFLLMLSAWAALLSRFGDCEQPVLATPVAGRNAPGLLSAVGFLANPVLLKIDLREQPSFAGIVQAARAGLLAALRHQEVPVAWVHDFWPLGAALRSMFVMEDASAWALPLPGIESRLLATPASLEARVDVALVVSQQGGETRIRLEYAERRIPADLAARLARGLAALIAGMAADPATPLDCLPLMDQPPALAQATLPMPAAHRLDALLRLRADGTPDAPAATDGRLTLSYADLQRHSDGLAGRLHARGVTPGARVGLVANASPLQLAGLLAILRCGATAVPLDPAYPPARLTATLADSGAVGVLSDLPLDYPAPRIALDDIAGSAPPAPVETQAPAAVIYTSGTTGQPKGVLLAHDALCRLGSALAEAYGIKPGDRVLQVVSPAFDVALSDIAMALSAGAMLVMPGREAVMPGRALLATLRDFAITHMQAPAAVLATTLPERLPSLRAVAVGGETCPPLAARRWADGRRLFVAYGPTEATVTAALAEYDPNAPAGSIGRPFGGARLQLLDAAGAAVPMGVPGELYIAGPGVARGYLDRPALTAERFLPDPDGPPGAYRYRTGDRARLETDGSLTFLGRLDRQVKLRGFRIEPGETEAALAALPGVLRALAAVRDDALGERRLVAWVLPQPGAQLDMARLRQTLRQHLPDHLVPALMAQISEIPLTLNGKIDWRALPTPAALVTQPPPARPPGPSSAAAVQRDLAALWGELLGCADIGPDDNFFDLGGHSLLLVRLQERLSERFGVDLPIGELFAHPTLRALAARLHAATAEPATEEFTL
ncbi:non-ribosomal peptide synthetase [Oceanibaculum pacificum]|uniref:Carrier domain-containing protein n=1 Tax=Oceanibaculum pacificum TaxID=580166 RepID=A0A154W7M1_9PROT|nr:non-ribosomal peptide synthetase [Oceanibaculum pacificum]KZD09517.1 hypothetical protein AUP43_07170 [Oceanibaculum pacificum]